jgi:hypothetical protein
MLMVRRRKNMKNILGPVRRASEPQHYCQVVWEPRGFPLLAGLKLMKMWTLMWMGMTPRNMDINNTQRLISYQPVRLMNPVKSGRELHCEVLV